MNSAFAAAGVQTKVVTRLDYTNENLEWADAVVTTGGDGTYLLGATRIRNNSKPLIGFNSDPMRSKGHLCIPKKYSINAAEAVEKLKAVSDQFSLYNILIFNYCGSASLHTLMYHNYLDMRNFLYCFRESLSGRSEIGSE